MTPPYLSLVVTARNDDHGGNLLGRMQAFINNWLNQARRFGIPSELIIVEWNPPADRPRLAEALRWPDEPGPCSVRIIEAPPEVHARLGHAAALPLYQMIGKNVGIRRARGRFVLATNIDIVFSSELAAFLAEQRLDPERMYRMDRHDTGSDVPVDADPEAQLEYCRTHLIRVNRREGTFPVRVTPAAATVTTGAVMTGAATAGVAVAPAVAPAGAKLETPGIALGDGWFPEERHGAREVFRWAGERASIAIETPPSASETLVLDVAPGPSADGPVHLEIAGPGGFVAAVTLEARCRLFLRADWRKVAHLEFATKNHLSGTPHDPRPLAFRIFRAEWTRARGRAGASVRRLPLGRRAKELQEAARHIATKLAHEGPLVNFTVFVSPAMRKLVAPFAGPRAPRPNAARSDAPPAPEPNAAPNAAPKAPPRTTLLPEFLHTNGCGDFTLLAREKWFDLRAYPEFDLFSMNLDSVFCYAAHHGGAREAMLADPMRIYHIEHGTGSGWTPEGQAALFQRIEARGLSYIDNDTVMQWAQQMRRFDAPMIFNHENWGFAGDDLPETVPVEAVGP